MPDENHPLYEAMRYMDSESDKAEEGIDAETLYARLELPRFEVIRYGAEQRALRAALLHSGRMKTIDPTKATPISLTPAEASFQQRLIPAYVDGMAIGWKGHQIASEP